MQAHGAQREPAYTGVAPDEPKVQESSYFIGLVRVDKKEIGYSTFYLLVDSRNVFPVGVAYLGCLSGLPIWVDRPDPESMQTGMRHRDPPCAAAFCRRTAARGRDRSGA